MQPIQSLSEINKCVRAAATAFKATHLIRELPFAATRYIFMETPAFKHLSQSAICLRMAMLCQRSADETPPGPEQDRHQAASDKFRIEADELAIQDLQRALLWPVRRH
jgi:hypothetical protein